MITPFLVALQLLTRVPVKINKKISDQATGRSLLYYPLIGFMIGICLSAIMILLHDFMPPLLLASVLLAIWVLITGALHLDGLADSADAWLGGFGDPQRTLDIMKDPRCGSAAVVILIIILLLKFAALEYIVRQQQWPLLIAACVFARTSLLPLFLTTKYVRQSGIGASLANNLPRLPAWIITLTIVIMLPVLTGIQMLYSYTIAISIWVFMRQLMVKRISGMTGDTAGAMIEIMELVILIGVCFW